MRRRNDGDMLKHDSNFVEEEHLKGPLTEERIEQSVRENEHLKSSGITYYINVPNSPDPTRTISNVRNWDVLANVINLLKIVSLRLDTVVFLRYRNLPNPPHHLMKYFFIVYQK